MTVGHSMAGLGLRRACFEGLTPPRFPHHAPLSLLTAEKIFHSPALCIYLHIHLSPPRPRSPRYSARREPWCDPNSCARGQHGSPTPNIARCAGGAGCYPHSSRRFILEKLQYPKHAQHSVNNQRIPHQYTTTAAAVGSDLGYVTSQSSLC